MLGFGSRLYADGCFFPVIIFCKRSGIEAELEPAGCAEVICRAGAVAVSFRALFRRFITALSSLDHSLTTPHHLSSLPPNDEDFHLASYSRFLSLHHPFARPLDDCHQSVTDCHRVHKAAILRLSAFSPAYFDIQEPQAGRQWQNGVANPAQWRKGLLDDIPYFDIEIGRLSVDGILLVATHGLSRSIHLLLSPADTFFLSIPRCPTVPASFTALNIYFDSVPTGDDYYMTFMNHTHGATHAISPKFSIVDSVSSDKGSQPSAVANVPTVTVSGAPNPTATFATAFPDTGSAVALLGIHGWASTALTVMCGVVTGAFLVFV